MLRFSLVASPIMALCAGDVGSVSSRLRRQRSASWPTLRTSRVQGKRADKENELTTSVVQKQVGAHRGLAGCVWVL